MSPKINILTCLIIALIQVDFNNCYGVELSPQDVSGMFRSVFTIVKTDLQHFAPLNLLTSQISGEISPSNINKHEIQKDDNNNFEAFVNSTISENVNLTKELNPLQNLTNSTVRTNDSNYINSLSSLSKATSATTASDLQISRPIIVDDNDDLEANNDLCVHYRNATKPVKDDVVTVSGIEIPISEKIANTGGNNELKIKSVLNYSTLTTIPNVSARVTYVLDSTEVVSDNYTKTTEATDNITLLVDNCGVALLDFRRGKIVGGVVANPKMFPWMVNVLVRQYHICAGTIITETFVLTAAHCLVKSNPRYIAVRSFAGFRRAKNVFVNPGFWIMKNDIGLIELAKPYWHLSPSCISNLPEPPVGATSLILGWGLTYEKGQPSNDLLAAEIQILHKKVCEDGYKGLYHSDMICAGSATGIPDTCHGDSGGPLLKLIEGIWYQLGIVSFGDGCGRPTTPGVYTKVELYLTWIKNIIEKTEIFK